MSSLYYLKKWLPETYLIASILYYWSLTANVINPVAITLLLVIFLLIWSKNRVLGTSIGIVLLLINIFMLFALASELNEFPTASKEFFVMLFAGLIYFVLNIAVAFFLLMKWFNYPKSNDIEVPAN